MNIIPNEVQKNGLRICADWISFTIPSWEGSTGALMAMSLLGYSHTDFQRMPRGAQGYKSMFRQSLYGISILFDGKKDMGIHVNIPGKAIHDCLLHFSRKHSSVTPFGSVAYEVDSFDVSFYSSVLRDLLRKIQEKGHLTRFDIAIDDIGANYYSLPALDKKLANNEYVSKFRGHESKISYHTGNELKGYTIYLGSRHSDIMLRVYDKQLEQNSRRVDDSDSLVEYPWTRWELELKDDYASRAAKFLVDGELLNTVACGILSNYVRFITLDATRKGNCSLDSVWESFIDGVSKLSLYKAPAPKTIDDKRNWLFRCVSRVFTTVVASDGYDLGVVHDMLRIGEHRLSGSDIALINQACFG